jgi:hypothetical protein
MSDEKLEIRDGCVYYNRSARDPGIDYKVIDERGYVCVQAAGLNADAMRRALTMWQAWKDTQPKGEHICKNWVMTQDNCGNYLHGKVAVGSDKQTMAYMTYNKGRKRLHIQNDVATKSKSIPLAVVMALLFSQLEDR